MFQLNITNQVTTLVNRKEEEAATKTTKTTETFIQETEAPFIPNIDRLPKQTVENARTYEDKIRLQYEMQRRDCEELQTQWACSLDFQRSHREIVSR